jgi:nucleotide-binding universal stress UspA family protein
MDRIRSIIVPTDFSEPSQAAALRAATLARLDGASIHLIHALRSPLVISAGEAPLPEAAWVGMREAAQQELEAMRKGIETKGISKVTAECSDSGDVVQLIEAAAEAHDADLVVMGTHGRGGLKHAFLGSVTERTLRAAPCSVLIVQVETAHGVAPR